MANYSIKGYEDKFLNEWDEFVISKSINGTFLQTRKFLNYHPNQRFKDTSWMVYIKGRLVAVCPGCEYIENGLRCCVSHRGSTFGGLVLSDMVYKAEYLIEIIHACEIYLKERGFDAWKLHITSDIFSKVDSNLLQYALYHEGYKEYIELSAYVDLVNLPENILDSFDRNKCRNIRKCEEYNLVFRELVSDKEIKEFYVLLTINLKKYGVAPIHTYEEILLLKREIIPSEIRFYGVFENGQMRAGGMLFIFKQTDVIHAQNLSADYRFTEYSPITYLYYRIIEQARADGFTKLSWGKSTEQAGKLLNLGLIRNKEAYGSKYDLNRTFYKNLTEIIE